MPKTLPSSAVTTLFDFNLSGGSLTGWNKTTSAQIGCEVLKGDVENQLLAMAGQFVTDADGWYGLILNIPGFLTHQWDYKSKSLEALIPQLIKLQSRAWVYLLKSNKIVMLLRVNDKKELVSFVQKLTGALEISNHQLPQAQLVDMKINQNILVKFAQHELDTQRNLEQEKNNEEIQERIKNLDFRISPDILTSRSSRLRPVVLIVEDDSSTAQLLEHLISQKRSLDIYMAPTAEEAAVIYRRTAPDLVFLDIGLPDINGLQLLESISRADRNASVVMLTANAYRQNLEHSSRYGAKGFIAKPFTAIKLSQVIKNILGIE